MKKWELSGNVELWEDCYHITVSMCSAACLNIVYKADKGLSVDWWGGLQREKLDLCLEMENMLRSCSANTFKSLNTPADFPVTHEQTCTRNYENLKRKATC